MKDYMDFELEIERVGKGKKFRARVIEAPAGGRAQAYFELPAAAIGWEADRDSMMRVAGKRHLRMESPAGATASALGRELFNRGICLPSVSLQ